MPSVLIDFDLDGWKKKSPVEFNGDVTHNPEPLSGHTARVMAATYAVQATGDARRTAMPGPVEGEKLPADAKRVRVRWAWSRAALICR